MQNLILLTESNAGQAWITENQEYIDEAANIFEEYPEVVKEHVMNNLDEFLVPGDLKATYESVVTFAESAVRTMLDNLSKMVAGEQIE